MVKLPEVFGLVACERLHVDPHARQLSLVGVFFQLRFASFPARIRELTIYAALFDARGEGELRLTYTRLETEEDLHYNSRWSSFPEPGRVTQVALPLRELRVPAPGRYSVTLSFDHNPIGKCFFDVLRA